MTGKVLLNTLQVDQSGYGILIRFKWRDRDGGLHKETACRAANEKAESTYNYFTRYFFQRNRAQFSKEEIDDTLNRLSAMLVY